MNDLLQIDGINGTMIANRNERVNGTTKLVRTVVTLDNGGEWNYVTHPKVDMNGAPLCEPPSCFLHFHIWHPVNMPDWVSTPRYCLYTGIYLLSTIIVCLL